MVWVDAKRQKGVREALFAGDGGMPKIVATRFHGGEDKVDLSTYDGAMNRADFTAWMSNVFEGDDAGMVLGVEFPELAADSLGFYERALHFQGSTLSWAQYFGAELVYMSIESGPAVPMGMILTVVMIPMLFQRPKRRKKPVRKRSEMDQDAVIELDDDALLLRAISSRTSNQPMTQPMTQSLSKRVAVLSEADTSTPALLLPSSSLV